MSPFRWILNIILLVGGFFVAVLVLESSGYFDFVTTKPQETADNSQAQLTTTVHSTGEIAIERGPGGHFWVEAYVENEPIRFIIDTGATHVFLTEADAEMVGFDFWDEDFKLTANTANGTARFAPVMIKEISLDDTIVVRQVSGAVIQGEGSVSLLGMSFLNQLSGFEVSGDEMILKP